jgi:hypothetical protein
MISKTIEGTNAGRLSEVILSENIYLFLIVCSLVTDPSTALPLPKHDYCWISTGTVCRGRTYLLLRFVARL